METEKQIDTLETVEMSEQELSTEVSNIQEISEIIETSVDQMQTECESEPETETVFQSNEVRAVINQWGKTAEERWYYIKNGELVKSCIIQIDGCYYAFDYDGNMYEDCTFYFEGNQYRAKKMEVFI